MDHEQEIFSKITFIKLIKKNYNGDGLELKQGDIALVSNEKCYQVMHDFPDKFEEIDFKNISTDTLKYIYDNRNKLIEKDDGRLIFESNLYNLLVVNPSQLKEYSEKITSEKEETREDFDEKLARMLFEKESEKLWRRAHSERAELLSKNLTPMGNLPTDRYISILEVYKKLGEKLVNLEFDTDKVVLKKSNIIFDSKIRPFLIQRIGAVINQWSKTSKVVIQELLPNTKDVKAKNFLISLLKENTKNLISNFKRDLDIELRMSDPEKEHSSSIIYIIGGEVIIIGILVSIGIGGTVGVVAGIGTIASILAILAYIGIKPKS